MAIDLTNYSLIELTERVKELEEKILRKKKRVQTTRGQQMLLLIQLGFLDTISELKLTKDKTAELLSIILNADYDNIYDDLVHMNEADSGLNITRNFNFLSTTYSKIGLKDLQAKAEIELENIQNKK